jgi:hypothetical protein
MTRRDMDGNVLLALEQRLRAAEYAPAEESLARVTKRLDSHTASHPHRGRGRLAIAMSVVGVALPVLAVVGIGLVVLRNQPARRLLTAVPASTATPSPAPDSTATPALAPAPLAVILQPAAAEAGPASLGVAPATIVLADLDGHEVSRVSVKPAQRPGFTNAATILPPQVHVVGGHVYYIDGDGVVRRLERDGSQAVVASFPTTEAQHMSAFAVSPDGSQVMASVYTYGARTSQLTPSAMTSGPSYELLEYARVGGDTRVIWKRPAPSTAGSFMVLGWDTVGPYAGTAVATATQNVTPQGWDSPVFHIDMSGSTTDQLGGPGCYAEFLSGGAVLCATGTYARPPYRVVDGAGNPGWPVAAGQYESATLGGSGDVFVTGAAIGDPGAQHGVYFRDGTMNPISETLYNLGFAGTTLFGAPDSNSFKLVTLSITGQKVGPARPYPIDGAFGGMIGG